MDEADSMDEEESVDARAFDEQDIADSEEEEGEDDSSWTLVRMSELTEEELRRHLAAPPARIVLRRLMREYCDIWHDDRGVYNPQTLLNYVYSRIVRGPLHRDDLPIEDLYRYETFLEKMERQSLFLNQRMMSFLQAADLRQDITIREQLEGVTRIHSLIFNFFNAVGRLHVASRTGCGATLQGAGILPESCRDKKVFDENEETYMRHNEGSNDNFQNAFMYLRSILEGLGYRRAEDRLFARVKTKAGLDTLAYSFSLTIKDFVSAYTSYTINFEAWRWATKPISNLRSLEEYISQRSIPEAPPLKENHHLRSYAGDAMGRGAVVYCSNSDFAFEYRLRKEWGGIAKMVTDLRREILNDPTYVCTPPSASDVCIVHLTCTFPHDILSELQLIKEEQDRGMVRFRECRTWEMDKGRTLVEDPVVSAHLADAIRERRPLGEEVGRRWRLLFSYDSCDVSHSQEAALDILELNTLKALCDGDSVSDTFELPFPPRQPIDPFSYVVLPPDGHMWKLVEAEAFFSAPMNEITDPAFLLSFSATQEEQRGDVLASSSIRIRTEDLGRVRDRITAQSFITLPDGRIYAPCKRVLIPLVDQEMQDRCAVPLVGARWERVVAEEDLQHCIELHDSSIRSCVEEAVARAEGEEGVDTVSTLPFDVAYHSFVRLSCGTAMRQVGVLSRTFDRHTHYLSHGERFFCADTGRGCFDCNTDEIDQIYTCQRFEDHDKFFLYSLKGRLLFRVGERDMHQMTLFLEGYGGCGKSTIMNAQMNFFPPHKRGILSSNIEPLFGMSQVMKEGQAEVIFCNEVATDLNLKQEEWQISTGGEMASYAVKNGKPLVMKCIAQHFWVGNSRPGFKNDQNQMGRRLAAVLMPYPVKPRDGSIPLVIDRKMGHLQRREVVSYHQFVRITGSCDPMSVPETLPPAFRDYHERCRRETDPVQDFIKDGSFVERVDVDKGFITIQHFKELYEQFRSMHNMTKVVKWGESVYRPAFNENHVHLKCVKEMVIDGAPKKNIMVAYGLRAVATATA